MKIFRRCLQPLRCLVAQYCCIVACAAMLLCARADVLVTPETSDILNLRTEYQCSTSQEWTGTLCNITNVVVHNGWLYFIRDDGQAPPEVPISASEGPVKYLEHYKVITSSELAAILSPQNSTSLHVEDVAHGLLWYRWLQHNYFHMFHENMANWHDRFCRLHGVCHFDVKELGTKLVLIADDSLIHNSKSDPAIAYATRCISHHSPVHILKGSRPWHEDVAFLVRSLTVGMGGGIYSVHGARGPKGPGSDPVTFSELDAASASRAVGLYRQQLLDCLAAGPLPEEPLKVRHMHMERQKKLASFHRLRREMLQASDTPKQQQEEPVALAAVPPSADSAAAMSADAKAASADVAVTSAAAAAAATSTDAVAAVDDNSGGSADAKWQVADAAAGGGSVGVGAAAVQGQGVSPSEPGLVQGEAVDQEKRYEASVAGPGAGAGPSTGADAGSSTGADAGSSTGLTLGQALWAKLSGSESLPPPSGATVDSPGANAVQAEVQAAAAAGSDAAGADVQAELPLPYITIIQRETSRQFIELEVVVEELQAALPQFKVRIVSMRGKSLEEINDIFGSSAVVLAHHGAVLANMVFLSPGSLYIDAVPVTYSKFHTTADHLQEYLRPFAYITAVGYDNSTNEDLVMNWDMITGSEAWGNMTTEEQQLFRDEFVCPKRWAWMGWSGHWRECVYVWKLTDTKGMHLRTPLLLDIIERELDLTRGVTRAMLQHEASVSAAGAAGAAGSGQEGGSGTSRLLRELVSAPGPSARERRDVRRRRLRSLSEWRAGWRAGWRVQAEAGGASPVVRQRRR